MRSNAHHLNGPPLPLASISEHCGAAWITNRSRTSCPGFSSLSRLANWGEWVIKDQLPYSRLPVDGAERREAGAGFRPGTPRSRSVQRRQGTATGPSRFGPQASPSSPSRVQRRGHTRPQAGCQVSGRSGRFGHRCAATPHNIGGEVITAGGGGVMRTEHTLTQWFLVC